MTRTEVELPVAVVLLCQSDLLTNENLTDEHKLAFPFDATVRVHVTDHERTRILDLADLLWVGPAIVLNSTGRCLLSEGLVRSHVIELLEEGIESSLLSPLLATPNDGR